MILYRMVDGKITEEEYDKVLFTENHLVILTKEHAYSFPAVSENVNEPINANKDKE